MKVTTAADNTFRPVTFNITFETREELNILSDLMGLDLSIPPEVYPRDIEKKELLSNLMWQLYHVFIKELP